MAPFQFVNREGLSRREISWLLAQEARGAAQALRQGLEVQVKESLKPPGGEESAPLSSPMLDGLTALDDAMSLLGELQNQKGVRRRGRLDVAVLVYELCPDAKLSVETTEGTEVFGDEEHVRRMLQLLLTHSGGQATNHAIGPAISIHRDGDYVHISAELGPDATDHSSLERRWLNRMALRAGGRHVITGRQQTLVLPADGAQKEKEMAALRHELEQAQELGEAYARELATVLGAAEEHAASAHQGEENEGLWRGGAMVARGFMESLKNANVPSTSQLFQAFVPLTSDGLEEPLSEQAKVSLHDLCAFAGAGQSALFAEKHQTLRVLSAEQSQKAPLYGQAAAEAMLTWLVVESHERAAQGTTIELEISGSEDDLVMITRFPKEGAKRAVNGVAAALLSTYLPVAGGQFRQFEKGDDIICLSTNLPLS